MGIIILIGLVSAIAAGLACVAEHGYAKRHGWGLLERYGAGALTWLIAFAPPMIGAVSVRMLAIGDAVLLYGIAGGILIGMGVATWACYRPSVALPDEDELDTKIANALRQK